MVAKYVVPRSCDHFLVSYKYSIEMSNIIKTSFIDDHENIMALKIHREINSGPGCYVIKTITGNTHTQRT